MNNLRFIFIGIFLLTALSMSLSAQDEAFSISKSIANNNNSPAVAIDKKGNAIVVWSSENTSTFTSKIYAAFLKYKKSSGKYVVKNARLISDGSENNYHPTVVYNQDDRSFHCAWVRSMPDFSEGSQLVIRKLNGRARPVGEINILHSHKSKNIYSPELVRLQPVTDVSSAGTDYEYAIAFNLSDSTKISKRINQIWIAGLNKTPSALEGARTLVSVKAKSFSDYFKFGDFVRLSDGSFLLAYNVFDRDGNDVVVLKASPQFKLQKERSFGSCVLDIYKLCATSADYVLLSWVTYDSGEFATMNQALASSLDLHKSAYEPYDSAPLPLPALAPLKAGGAVQLLGAPGEVIGCLLSEMGELESEFLVDQITQLPVANVLVEITGRNKAFLIYSGEAKMGKSNLMGVVIDLPEK